MSGKSKYFPVLQKIISFVYSLTRKVKSAYSGYLELTLDNGKLLLNSLHTNYSYGSLQRVLRFSLKQIDVTDVNHALVLGLGGGCVLKTLRSEFNYTGQITAVEIDPVVVDIATNEFGIVCNDKTNIICQDAFHFMKIQNKTYDLVIIDLFIDNRVPEQFLLLEFWRQVITSVNPGGHIIFNTLCAPRTEIGAIKEKLNRRGFNWKVYRYVERTNRVLIANHN